MRSGLLRGLACMAVMAGVILLPGVKAEAAQDVPYYSWLEKGGKWDGTNYVLDGEVIKDAFFFDGIHTYFLQSDGTPMVNRLTYHPDGEHIIYFDENGHEVFNQEKHITQSITGETVSDYCYFGAEGYMFKDETAFVFSFSSQKYNQPVYYNVNGVKQMGGQFYFADGNIGIADKNGNLQFNSFGYDAFGQIVYFHWNGTIARGLISDGDYFYDMDMKDGHLKGWFSAEGVKDSKVFPGGVINDRIGSIEGEDPLYELRITGNNAISNSIKDWYAFGDVADYMEEKYGVENDWKLDIYRDANGNVVDSESKQSGTYSTFRGVTIGDNRKKVIEAYEGIGLIQAQIDLYKNHWLDLFEAETNERVDEYIISFEQEHESTVGWLENMIKQYCKVKGIRFYYDENNCVEKIQYFYYRTANHGIKRVVTEYKDVPLPVEFDASTSKYANENTTYQWYNWGVHTDEIIKDQTTSIYQLTPEVYGNNLYMIFVCKLTDTVTGEITEAYFLVDNGD